jgi:DNA ligase (NAD+)
VVAAHVAAFFASKAHRSVIKTLREQGVTWPEMAAPSDGGQTLAGRTFVITGTLESMTREQAQEALEARGAKVSGSVSKKTGYLVAGSDAGSKLARARELNVPVLDERNFLELLERGGPQ